MSGRRVTLFSGNLSRRRFLAGAAGLCLSATVRAEEPGAVRSIGFLMSILRSNRDVPARVAAFEAGLANLGWTAGREIAIDYRWAGGDAESIRREAASLVTSSPEVIVSTSTPATQALQARTATIPIVFLNLSDPVGSGVVESLASPGGNATGFTSFEDSLGAKWLETLHQAAPDLRRVAIINNPATSAFGLRYLRSAQEAGPGFGIDVVGPGFSDTAALSAFLAGFAEAGRGGLIVTPDLFTNTHWQQIVTAAAAFATPAIYFARFIVEGGGLMSYGPDYIDQYRIVATYVDRILRGAAPGELPVQAASKFELVINIGAAAELGLTVPTTLLATATEVIE